MRGDWKWYISIAAVRQWMDLTNRTGPLEDTNPDFLMAQDELGDISMTATLAAGATGKQRNGASIYRAPAIVRGKRLRYRSAPARAECTVMPPLKSEGPLPQLVRVTLK